MWRSRESLSRSSEGTYVPIFSIWWLNSLKNKRKWRPWSPGLYNKIIWASNSMNFTKFSKTDPTNSRPMLISPKSASFGKDPSLPSPKWILRIRKKFSALKYSELWANNIWLTTTSPTSTTPSKSSPNPKDSIWKAFAKYCPSDFIIFHHLPILRYYYSLYQLTYIPWALPITLPSLSYLTLLAPIPSPLSPPVKVALSDPNRWDESEDETHSSHDKILLA